MEFDYLLGLQRLRELLPQNNVSAREEFFLLDARLRRNLADRQRYGRDNTNDVQFARIVDTLDAFLNKQLHLSVHFIDLCKSDNTGSRPFNELDADPSPSKRQRQLAPWQEGDKVSVQGQDYWINNPVQKQWFDKNGTLHLQAPGRNAQTGQKVWLKQCQFSRPYETASILKRDLEKEGRLLLKLQQEGQRDFPHWLGSENAQQSTTLVYERLTGRSLAAAFGMLPKPLDHLTAKRLLVGRYTLVQMLHVLHTRMHCSHRMLTPETLLLQVSTNNIILSDVGLAARTVQPGEGPQCYQAPEQIRGLPMPDRATDIYQLGALFYHLLTGQYITDGAAFQESNLAPGLDTILRKATSPNTRDRWPDVYAFSQALRQAGY